VVALESRMSVINKMLQDLDRRQALGAGTETTVVRAPGAKTGGHEWFWRTLVVLLAIALGWIGWVAMQLMPKKPVATELAFQAAAEAQSRAASKPAPATNDALRLATQLETPVREQAEPRPEAATPLPGNNTAEAHFGRAALLLSHGRVSEAETELLAALRADASHVAARQAYVTLLVEQRRVGTARQVLLEALAINPEQPAFAVALARIYTGQRDYAAALAVLDRAGAATANADFQAMRGTVLQRLGRHAEAIDAYQAALRGATQPATSWIGLGISLEALGRQSEAAAAYRRALTAGPMEAQAREYAESRARALE
jgi:MSHA biogenesis protein MshN